MFGIIQNLLAAKLHAQNNPGASVTVSLPLSDPRAQKLAKFAKKLMIPTTKIRASGLATQTGIDCSDNTEEFLEELHKALGDELYAELMTDLGDQIEISRAKKRKEEAQTAPDASALSDGIHALGEAGALADMPLRDRIVNVADALKRGEIDL